LNEQTVVGQTNETKDLRLMFSQERMLNDSKGHCSKKRQASTSFQYNSLITVYVREYSNVI